MAFHATYVWDVPNNAQKRLKLAIFFKIFLGQKTILITSIVTKSVGPSITSFFWQAETKTANNLFCVFELIHGKPQNGIFFLGFDTWFRFAWLIAIVWYLVQPFVMLTCQAKTVKNSIFGRKKFLTNCPHHV